MKRVISFVQDIILHNSWEKLLLQTFYKSCMTDLNDEKMVEVSMDGPNVNKAFLSILKEERQTNESSTLIDSGTCGLHTVNGSLQTGVKSHRLEPEEVIVFNVPNFSQKSIKSQ